MTRASTRADGGEADRLALRRLIGKAASAATAAQAATNRTARELVNAVAEGALGNLGHAPIVILAQRSEAASAQSALIRERIKGLQRIENRGDQLNDPDELRAAAQLTLEAGEALCREADAIQRQLNVDTADRAPTTSTG